MSDLNFDYLILFMADVPETFRTDATLTTFGIDNIKDKALKSVRQGLIDEANKRTRSYIDAAWITDENIDGYDEKTVWEGNREHEEFLCPECGNVIGTAFTDQIPTVRLIKKGSKEK